MFTLWSLIEASLLCLNAVCILHEERFLAKGMYFTLTFNICCLCWFKSVQILLKRDDFDELQLDGEQLARLKVLANQQWKRNY